MIPRPSSVSYANSLWLCLHVHVTIRRRGENRIIAVDHLVVFVDDGLIAASLLVVPDPDLVQGSRRAGSPAQLKC